MATTAKAAIMVEPDVAELIREAVADGHFASTDEALRSALQGLKASRDVLLGIAPSELERLWDEGLASGPGRPADFDMIRKEVLQRADER